MEPAVKTASNEDAKPAEVDFVISIAGEFIRRGSSMRRNRFADPAR